MRIFSDAKEASLPLLVRLRFLKVNQNFMIQLDGKRANVIFQTYQLCTHSVTRTLNSNGNCAFGRDKHEVLFDDFISQLR